MTYATEPLHDDSINVNVAIEVIENIVDKEGISKKNASTLNTTHGGRTPHDIHETYQGQLISDNHYANWSYGGYALVHQVPQWTGNLDEWRTWLQYQWEYSNQRPCK